MGLEAFTGSLLAAIEEFGELDDTKFANKIVGTFMRGGILLLPKEMKALVKDIVKEIDTLKGNSYNQLSIEEKKPHVKEIVCRHLRRLLGSEELANPINLKKGEPNIVLFIGCAMDDPRKYGKVTAIARYARHQKKNGCRTYVVCADPLRSDAYDRLQPLLEGIRCHNCQQMPGGMPVQTAIEGFKAMKKEDDALTTATESDSENPSLFIMDVNTKDWCQIAEGIGHPYNVILVMDGKAQIDPHLELFLFTWDTTALWIARGLIITKADESLSALYFSARKCAILMIGMGAEIDDYELSAASFIKKLLEPLDDQSGISAQNSPLPLMDVSADESLNQSDEALEKIEGESEPAAPGQISDSEVSADESSKQSDEALIKIERESEPVAPEQISGSEIIDAGTTPVVEAAHHENNMDTDDTNDNLKESGSAAEQRSTNSEAEDGIIIESSFSYEMIDNSSCFARYRDGRAEKLYVIRLMEGDQNTLDFYRSVRHANLLDYRFDHLCKDGRYNVGFERFDQSLVNYLKERVGEKLILTYTLLSTTASADDKHNTEYLPPIVRGVLKDIVSVMVVLIENDQELKSLSLENFGVKGNVVKFYDPLLCKTIDRDSSGTQTPSKTPSKTQCRIGSMFSGLITSLFKCFDINVETQGTNDLKSLVKELKFFDQLQPSRVNVFFILNNMALLSPKDRVSLIGNFWDKRFCIGKFNLYHKCVDNMKFQKDWTLKFQKKEVGLHPVNKVFFHGGGYKNTADALVNFCRCLSRHLFEEFYQDKAPMFDTMDVDLTIMGLFGHELISLHENLKEYLEFFLS